MTVIHVDNLHIHLPIFSISSLSLKKRLLNLSSNGRLQTSSKTAVIEAIRGISFDLQDGDRVGLIGSNGAGKTTLLRALSGIYQPTSGAISVSGNVMPLLAVGIGIYEDASGFENIRNSALSLGMTRAELDEKIDDIAAFSGLNEYLHLPMYTYSLGMRTRLSFAVVTAFESDILLMDEVLSAGDAAFLEQANKRFASFLERARVLILASHSMDWILKSCTKAMLMEDGYLKDFDNAETVVKSYINASTG